MILSFELTMPRVNSWNGRWSGQEKRHIIIKSFSTKKSIENGNKILGQGSFYYDFGDGWGAQINVTEVNSEESKRLKKISAGFCGYDWMVDSIIRYGDIEYRK